MTSDCPDATWKVEYHAGNVDLDACPFSEAAPKGSLSLVATKLQLHANSTGSSTGTGGEAEQDNRDQKHHQQAAQSQCSLVGWPSYLGHPDSLAEFGDAIVTISAARVSTGVVSRTCRAIAAAGCGLAVAHQNVAASTALCISAGATMALGEDADDEDTACAPDQFTCSDGKWCISGAWQCDGYDDCNDGSDEGTSCIPPCAPDLFTCNDGKQCIYGALHCNGESDCRDGSDEGTSCIPPCAPDQFTCNDGKQCISGAGQCNGESDWRDVDCRDGSDEAVGMGCPLCAPDQFTCNDGKWCISGARQCDGHDNCDDGSDEGTSCIPPCAPDQFTCNDGKQCIYGAWQCDGHDNCNDGSDEGTSCIPPCAPDQFLCNGGQQCIFGAGQCDGYDDCRDGSDEAAGMGCPCPNVDVVVTVPWPGGELTVVGDMYTINLRSAPSQPPPQRSRRTFGRQLQFIDVGGICGRPFVINGTARVASDAASVAPDKFVSESFGKSRYVHNTTTANSIDGTDQRATTWLGAFTVQGASDSPHAALADSTRATIADHWRHAGAAEHASIASFSRHALQLLAIGAPPSLVEAAHSAGMDEIKHATMCYGLAQAYSGESVGPGKLAIAGAITTDDETAEGVLSSVIQEGCLGETAAAFEAFAAAAGATEPTVKQVLDTIAADESRHAQLGWSFVQWYLSEPNLNSGAASAADDAGEQATKESVRKVTVVETLFARHLDTFAGNAIRRTDRDGDGVDDAGIDRIVDEVGFDEDSTAVLLEHGILTLARWRQLRALLVKEVVAPMLARLVAGGGGDDGAVDVVERLKRTAARHGFLLREQSPIKN